MMQQYKVSVIVPVYNVEPFLEQCVDSILAQTHSDLQIILVDDGSKDGSGVLCDRLSKKDSRIEVIHKENAGSSSARNVGLEIAKGDYISFIDSDDFIDTTMYEQMLNVFRKSNCDIVGCAINRYYYKENIYKQYIHFHYTEILTDFAQAELEKLHILCQIDCSACNKLFKREIIINERFKEGVVTNEDFSFFYYLYKKTRKLTYLNLPLYFYRYTENSVSNSFNQKSFHIIDTGLDIKRDIERCGKNELKPVVDRYLYTMCFAYCFAIRYKCTGGEFKERYDQMFGLLMDNLKTIMLNPYFSNLRKIAIVLFVKCTFAFDIIYKLLKFMKQFKPQKRSQIDQNRI